MRDARDFGYPIGQHDLDVGKRLIARAEGQRHIRDVNAVHDNLLQSPASWCAKQLQAALTADASHLERPVVADVGAREVAVERRQIHVGREGRDIDVPRGGHIRTVECDAP